MNDEQSTSLSLYVASSFAAYKGMQRNLTKESDEAILAWIRTHRADVKLKNSYA